EQKIFEPICEKIEYKNIIDELKKELTSLKDRYHAFENQKFIPQAFADYSLSKDHDREAATKFLGMVSPKKRQLIEEIRAEMTEKFSTLLVLKRALSECEEKILTLANKKNDLQNNIPNVGTSVNEAVQKGIAPTEQELLTEHPVKMDLSHSDAIEKELTEKKTEKKSIVEKIELVYEKMESLRNEKIAQLGVPEHKETRKALEMEYRVHKLQIDKITLEDNNTLCRHMIRQKDLTIQKLVEQLALRDQWLQSQCTGATPATANPQFIDLHTLKEVIYSSFLF
ncbi:kinesin-like protein, partial [Reticulomyxa filosa]